MNPKSEALAFRIWQAAQPVGWDVTIREMAEMLGEPAQRVRSIVIHRRWLSRFRAARNDIHHNSDGIIYGTVGYATKLHDLTDIVGHK